MRLTLLMTTIPLVLVACTNTPTNTRLAEDNAAIMNEVIASPALPAAQTSLVAADGAAQGTAWITEAGGGVSVRVRATGLSVGTHGIHLHTVGRCDPPGFASGGPHWNPTAAEHGRENPNGAHSGDLPNITIGADGRGTLEFSIVGATVAGLMDTDGSALIVHAKADDYRTDPSGNSGDRIACGVIEMAR